MLFHNVCVWALLSRCIQNLSSSHNLLPGLLQLPLTILYSGSCSPTPGYSQHTNQNDPSLLNVKPNSDHMTSLLKMLQWFLLPPRVKVKAYKSLHYLPIALCQPAYTIFSPVLLPLVHCTWWSLCCFSSTSGTLRGSFAVILST